MKLPLHPGMMWEFVAFPPAKMSMHSFPFDMEHEGARGVGVAGVVAGVKCPECDFVGGMGLELLAHYVQIHAHDNPNFVAAAPSPAHYAAAGRKRKRVDMPQMNMVLNCGVAA